MFFFLSPKMLLHEEVITIGASLIHYGADQIVSGKCSIGAFVGLIDPSASKYFCKIRIQEWEKKFIGYGTRCDS